MHPTTEVELVEPENHEFVETPKIPVRPGISPETLKKAGICLVDQHEPDSIEIPYHNLAGDRIGFSRWRLPKTRPSGQKYHQLRDSGVHVYFPPGVGNAGPGRDLIITEGEFKALSAYEAGLCAVGLPSFGTYSNDIDGEPKLYDEISEALRFFRPKRILFVGDNDTSLNVAFSRNAVFLARKTNPVSVLLPRIPLGMPKGLDDVRQQLNAGFRKWWDLIVAQAVLVDPKMTSGSLAYFLFDLESGHIEESAGEKRVYYERRMMQMVQDLRSEPIAVARMERALAKIMGVSKFDVRKGVKAAAKKMRERVHLGIHDVKSNPGNALSEAKSEPESIVFQQVAEKFGPPFLTRVDQDEQIITTGVAESFWAGLFCHKNRILFEPTERCFYQYKEETGVWALISPDCLGQRVSGLLFSAANVSTEHERSLLEGARTASRLKALLDQIRGIAEQRDAFSNPRRYIHASNQIVDFDPAGRFIDRKFSPELYSRNALPVAFDPTAGASRFLNELILPAVNEEDADLLQRWFGLAILQNNLPQRFLILEGHEGRGKTQIAALARLLVGSANTGQLRTPHLDQRFELYRLRAKTLLIGADVKGDFLSHPSASTLKSLVGGDPLEAEPKGGNDGYNLTGNFNVLITCNERLRVRIEGDLGAWRRRLLVVRFEAPPPEKKITNFAEKLFEEEGSGILTWAISGARKLLSEIDETGDFRLSDRQLTRVNSLLALK